MMEKNKKSWWILLGVLVVIALVLGGIILARGLMNRKAFNARPLVLIHQPLMMDSYQVGEGILIHATAREDQGLARMEVWANDQLVKAVDAEKPWPANLAISAYWIPDFEGKPQIVVRAISAASSAGQSTVQITVVQAENLTHVVSEGESLASIAADYGITPERLLDLNQGLEGDEPEEGEELIIPGGGSEPPSPPAAAEDDGDPPPLEGEVPLLGYAFPLLDIFASDPGNLTLRLEVPILRTWEEYDGLHCYVSLGDSLPQWYPDRDNEQATDEYFNPLDHGWWNTGGTLVGDSAPIISWPGDQPLTISFACVGVRGGTEALELGQIDLEIGPEEWDGSTVYHESDGEGGHLLLVTKITQLSGDPRNTPKYPDPDLPGPTNVRLNEEEGTLEWDYVPVEDEPIDGFRIYLNGTLQWSVDADARSTRLPPEWFRPPCAWIYTFGVTSYRIEFPDGPESDPPAEVDLEQPREGCMRLMRVTFLELQTFDLGEDGSHERRHGDVGPAYGTFYANEARVSFDQGYEGSGLDMPEGLRHNTTYDLAVVSGDPAWQFDGPNSIVSEVPFEGELQLGYVIMDRDNNPDDQLCDGFAYPIRDAYGQLDGYHQATMTSENGRCRVTFEYEPTEDSPVGERYVGAEPLPWIDLAGFYVD
ncbi:MAG: LysM peptidoglycan-binding domain-containing protein, partial [Anaerolineales bacterium]